MRGAVEGVPPLLQPVAHSLIYVREELQRLLPPLATDRLWDRPAGAASIGFHVRHLAGSLERLFTYARGESLSAEQLAALKTEGHAGEPPADASTLLAHAEAVIERAMAQLRAMSETTLVEPRTVGRKQLPSTVIGLLFHAAEHAQRHLGQIVTTAMVLGSNGR
jgi:uncharacterized damage-inducible protein DinB